MALPSSLKELPHELLAADNLPSLPTVAMEVLRLTQDEECTLDDLAQALSRDPALAAKLLKLSNSSLFSTGHEVTTLQRAAMVLGMKTVKLMSLSFSLASSLPTGGKNGSFDMEEYWRRSLISSTTARALAHHLRSPLADEAFLCGLLGHVGRLVMSQCLGESYDSICAAHDGWPDLAAENAGLGYSSADVSTALLVHWELPELIALGAGFQHRASELPPESDEHVQNLVRMLQLTTMIEGLLCETGDKDVLADIRKYAQETYGIEAADIESFLMELEPQIAETASVLQIELPQGKTHREILDAAQRQLVAVSLGAVADLQASQREAAALHDQNKVLEEQASTDKLTGLPNRSAFDDFMSRQINARMRAKLPRALGLVMVDVDKFKSFNDTHGHQAGDEVLRMVGAVLQRMTRKGDLPARYGGEEFAVIAPQTTPFGLKTLAERLRQAIEAEVLDWNGERLQVTASFGGACIAKVESERDAEKLFKLADGLLYRAKENGRNRCEVYSKVNFPGS